MQNYLIPDWPAPKHIRAYTTTRLSGDSQDQFSRFNLAMHVGDKQTAVENNRQRLQRDLNLPAEPKWLNQTHSTKAVIADQLNDIPEADASWTMQSNIICVTLTADCLPLLICDKSGTCVAAIHAGWRGLAAGIIEATIEKLPVNANELLVWLGPAIGPTAFEVGEEVYQLFLQHNKAAENAFKILSQNKWLANIYQLAKQRLNNLGVENIYGGSECTFLDNERFYSYRRDNITGRMASLIWIEE